MLTEMAIADAYAIAWEFTNDQKGELDFTQYYQHPTYLELRPGMFTDDTQRAIANSTLLLQDLDGHIFNPQAYLTYLYMTYKGDPREGYSRNFQRLLKESNTPQEFQRACRRTAVSNGSLMGVAPLGYISDLADLKLAASAQAMSTHHPDTAIHAQLVAMSAHYFIYDLGEIKDLRTFLLANADWRDKSDDAENWLNLVDVYKQTSQKPTIKAASISAYALYAIETFDSMTGIIRDAVTRGGDTDSAAASSVAIASVCPEIKNDIPQALYDQLDIETRFDLFELGNLDQALVDYSVDARA